MENQKIKVKYYFHLYANDFVFHLFTDISCNYSYFNNLSKDDQ